MKRRAADFSLENHLWMGDAEKQLDSCIRRERKRRAAGKQQGQEQHICPQHPLQEALSDDDRKRLYDNKKIEIDEVVPK